MGVLKNGPNGGFSGKAGSVIGSSWKKVEYIKGLPKLRKSPPKANEIKNRTKFALMQEWLGNLRIFFTLGLLNYSNRMTAFNAAISLNKNAIHFDGEQLQIDYPSIILSHGNLAAPEEPVLTISNGLIDLRWKSRNGKQSRDHDELLFACYSEELKQAFFNVGSTSRGTQMLVTELPQEFMGKTIEVYMAFCSRDRKRASMSRYMGHFQL